MQIRGEQEKLEESLSALCAHEKKQAGNCVIHLFGFGDREAVNDIFGHTQGNHITLVMQGLNKTIVKKSTEVSRLISSTQMPNSHRKPYSDTVTEGKE